MHKIRHKLCNAHFTQLLAIRVSRGASLLPQSLTQSVSPCVLLILQTLWVLCQLTSEWVLPDFTLIIFRSPCKSSIPWNISPALSYLCFSNLWSWASSQLPPKMTRQLLTLPTPCSPHNYLDRLSSVVSPGFSIQTLAFGWLQSKQTLFWFHFPTNLYVVSDKMFLRVIFLGFFAFIFVGRNEKKTDGKQNREGRDN